MSQYEKLQKNESAFDKLSINQRIAIKTQRCIFSGYFSIAEVSFGLHRVTNAIQNYCVMYDIGVLYLNGTIDVREHRRSNQRWTIQRNWQHMAQKTKQINRNTTQYVLDTTMRKQTQIT